MKKEPLSFHPFLKTVLWGGTKISRYKNIESEEPNVGESWEISAIPGHVSVVSDGVYKGRTLDELVDEFGEDLLGRRVTERYGKTFPLLVKFIDAADNVSIQVHPGDALARARHNSLGKTEMWYIIDSDPGAKILAGLKERMTPEDYMRRISDKTFADAIAVHDSNPGDVFFLPAGKVHAIGAGNLLAEIQASSDITYRIYDYDRRDGSGHTRELHTQLAKDAIDYSLYSAYKSPSPSADIKDCEIVKCPEFTIRRIIVDGCHELISDSGSFVILMCIDGEATLKYEEGESVIRRGQTMFLPAVLKHVNLEGSATILLIHI